MNIIQFTSAKTFSYVSPFFQKGFTLLSRYVYPYFGNASQIRTYVMWNHFPLEGKTLLSSSRLENLSFSTLSNVNKEVSVEQKVPMEAGQQSVEQVNPSPKEGFPIWSKVAITVAIAGVGLAVAIYLAREGKDTVVKPEPPSKEVTETREFVNGFNLKIQGCSMEEKQKYHQEALLFLLKIKRWGGLAQSSNLPSDIPLARLCFVEMLHCNEELVRVQALDYLTKLLQTGFNPYATLNEIATLEKALGQSLEKFDITHVPPPVLEQTIKAYTLVLEHMRIYLAKNQGQTSFHNKAEILQRTKNVSSKLMSTQFQYQASSIDSLASNLNYQPRPIQNSIGSTLDFLEQVREPAGNLYEFFETDEWMTKSFFSLFFGKNESAKEWLKSNSGLLKDKLKDADRDLLQKLVDDLTAVGQASIGYGNKLNLLWGNSIDKKQAMHEKILQSKSIWTYLPHSKESIRGVSEIINADCQSKEEWELLYGAVELFGEVILSQKEKQEVKEEALESVFALLDHPFITPVVSYKIGELFVLLKDTDNDLLQRKAETKKKHTNFTQKEVREHLSWFEHVRSAKQEIYEQAQNLHLNMYSKGALKLLASDEIASDKMYSQLSAILPTQSKYFIERSTPLERISDEFRKNTTNIQVIHGLGGNGKTQLAIKYARLNVLEYRFIYWVKSESLEVLKADLARLADIVIPDQGAGEDKLKFLKSWLEKEDNSGWLLVFDNVDRIKEQAFSSEFIKYVPNKGGHVLITSRITDQLQWERFSQKTSFYPLNTFSLHQSLQYLKCALPSQVSEDNIDAAKKVIEAMGQLPLGLAQAVGFLKNHSHINMNGFLKRFEEQKTLLDENFLNSEEYPASLATAWLMNMAEIRKSKEADILLTLCAFLSPEDISVDFLNQWMWYHETHEQKSSIHPQLDAAVKLLCDYSMVDSHTNSDKELISVHRLVQKMVRQSSLNENHSDSLIALKEAIDQMVLLPSIARYNPRYNYTLSPFREMLPHSEYLLQHANELIQPTDIDPIPFVQLALIVNRYFTETERNIRQAEKYLKFASDWVEKVDHPFKAKVQLAKGVVEFKKGSKDKESYRNALKYFESARSLYTQYGDNEKYAHLEERSSKCNQTYQLAISLLYQAETYIALGDHGKARELLPLAEAEFLSIPKIEDRFDIPRILRFEGLIFQKERNYSAAKEKVLAAEKMQHDVYGKTFDSEPTVAVNFSTLGDIYQDLEEYEEANKAYQKATQMNKEIYKTEIHEYIARLYGKRGQMLEKLGNLEEAQAMRKKQKDILDELKAMGR